MLHALLSNILHSIALMMEAARTSETLVNYQTTRRYNTEDSHLHTHRRENLKSYPTFNSPVIGDVTITE
jgi:hypothetical protein